MTDRTARPVSLLALALMLSAAASPATASVHHRTSDHHHISRHSSSPRQTKKSSHHHATKPVEHHDAKPSGVTSVPSGGMKLFCPAHRNALLIRKSTQGAGTTVTVVCR